MFVFAIEEIKYNLLEYGRFQPKIHSSCCIMTVSLYISHIPKFINETNLKSVTRLRIDSWSFILM